MYALADEIEAGRVKRPAKTFLDLAYKVAGMIFCLIRSVPVRGPNRQNRSGCRRSLALPSMD